MEKEFITHEASNKEAWICICGNTPCGCGFYSCDKNGFEIAPDKDWDGRSYVCDECGRLIDGDTLEVIGERNPTLLV